MAARLLWRARRAQREVAAAARKGPAPATAAAPSEQQPDDGEDHDQSSCRRAGDDLGVETHWRLLEEREPARLRPHTARRREDVVDGFAGPGAAGLTGHPARDLALERSVVVVLVAVHADRSRIRVMHGLIIGQRRSEQLEPAMEPRLRVRLPSEGAATSVSGRSR
jgi:hypothetical protein